MNMIAKTLACASAVVAASVAWAQFDDDDIESDEPAELEETEESATDDEDAEAEGEDGEESEAKGEKPKAVKVSLEKPFFLMPMCRMLEGEGEVMRPGASDWVAVEEGRYYPLGCAYRTVGANSRLVIKFGEGSEVSLSGGASFATIRKELSDRSRVIALDGGSVTVKLPRGLGPGMFTVTAPGFSVENLEGESRYTYRRTGVGDEAIVRCVTGAMAIKGRHFEIAKVSVANELRIRSSQDHLFTGLYGNSGDIIVKLDQGLVSVMDFETKESTDEHRYLDWHLSPKTAVRIHRAMPEIGERMSVTVMTFDTKGELQNRCSFAEGRSEINTGEEGAGVLEKRDEAAAKKAAEAAETLAVDEDVVEDEEEDDSDSGDDSSGEDDASSDDGDDEEEDLF